MSQRTKTVLVAAAFVLGVGLMIPFEEAITRVLGVASLFAFIVGGLFLIAEPGFLAADDEPTAGDGGDRPTPQSEPTAAGGDGPETIGR